MRRFKGQTSEEAPSNATKQMVAAAKQHLEKHCEELMKTEEFAGEEGAV